MRVMVTGGAGYIGSHAVKRLLSDGHEVCVIDNLFRGHSAAIDQLRKLPGDASKRLAFERGDIGDAKENLRAAEEKFKELDAQFQEDLKQLEQSLAADALELEELEVAPRKSDLDVQSVALVWTPWSVDSAGIAEPLF